MKKSKTLCLYFCVPERQVKKPLFIPCHLLHLYLVNMVICVAKEDVCLLHLWL